ncbi:hypothetical protein [Microbacterium sp. EST19A]|uniref:hypothetical protein n=1 Tax=Microbacterium sp. EST19A TaxID=2862681 RepID=UPI001CBC567C|nr:hypothetical protein [Microbacterium sp. EST19A]
MGEWLGTYGSLIILIVIAMLIFGVVRWRIRQFESVEFDQLEMDEMAEAVLTDLRAYSSGPREPIKVPLSYWRSIGWTNDKLLTLLRYMVSRGWIILPGFDWTFQRVLRTNLPESAALTQSSYEQYTMRPSSEPSVVVNGPAHFGTGDQVFTGDVEFNWHEVERRVDELVLDIHREMGRYDSATSARLAEIAAILSQANDARSYREPQVRSALRWLVGFATDASSNAAGTGLAAAASALLGLLA